MQSSERHPSKVSLLQHLRDTEFPIECILDVGIHFGTFELIQGFPEKKHYLFEPIEEHFESIEKIYSDAKIDYELNKVAVSNSDGTAELTVSSVIDGHDVTHAKFAGNEAPTETLRTVPTLKLDTFVADHQPSAPFLLKIDVDGAEELILEGAQKALQSCSVLILESPYYSIAKRLQLGMSAGFELLDIIDFCYYDGYLAQVDLVFVNPKFAPSHYTDMFKGGFSIEKWHNYNPYRKKRKRGLRGLFDKR